MGKSKLLRRLLVLALASVMLLGLAMPAGASQAGDGGLRFERVDNSAVSTDLSEREALQTLEMEDVHLPTEVVRVSIILGEASTVDAGYELEGIASDAEAMAYRDGLKARQADVERAISTQALGGETLDVVWNLTLAANLISANVPYGKIDAIKAVDGVTDVVVEERYEPDVVGTETLDPNMATSGEMIGSQVAYTAGYTGAGSRVAIIDTGTDVKHQSFNAEAFDYALAQNAGEDTGYIAGLDLLDAEEIAGVLSQLNIANKGVTAEQLYINSKLPFGFNYVDGNTDVTHENDTQGEHGSHVAGIATANRYIPEGDGFVAAMDSVMTQGVAPDAQLITMKVFGRAGGAYSADYMAAIEDAIVLGCDAINLSLGSGNPGASFNLTAAYQAILDSLAEHGAVVSMSAGNSGTWVANTVNGVPYLYADDVSLDMVGSPGSFTNSLSVASVDNTGRTGNFLKVGDLNVFFSETDYTNEPVATLDKSEDGAGTEYDYIFFTNTGADSSGNSLLTPYADAIEGKVVFVYRGGSSFFQKHMAAADAGAVACVVNNNQAGAINMNLEGSKATIPCVSILQADAEAIMAASTPVYDEDGETVLYYTGKLSVSSAVGVALTETDYYTMSSFSSWGVPGSLELKPEITAPGGNIYSVNGAHAGDGANLGTHDAYENMSGTSMSAPQVAGMAAVVAQYIREEGLVEKTGVSARKLAQSLLMSTAEPMLEAATDNYYSLLNQGAGLANVGAAVTAKSYILMDEDASAGAADGKVKAELGDDPDRTGVYSFGFTLYNLTGDEATYDLSADVFTQQLFNYDGSLYLDTWTWGVGATASFSSGDTVTLPAGGSAHVTATIELSAEDKAFLDAYYTSGAYIEAFVYVTERATGEGVLGTAHSIPVLGFYGNWTDASMYDVGSLVEFWYGTEARYPYLPDSDGYPDMFVNYATVYYAADPGEYYFFGNPLTDDDAYIPARNALNNTNGDRLLNYYYSPIRNAAGALYQVTDAETGEVYHREELGAVNGAYYHTNSAAWYSTDQAQTLNWAGTGADGEPLPEGTAVNVSLVLAPEYYGTRTYTDDGVALSFDWDALTDGVLGEGAYLNTMVTIDNTAPVLSEVTLTETGILATAQDNQYIAVVAVYNADGTREITYAAPNQETANTAFTAELDMSGAYGTEFFIAVYDYAMNQSTYAVTLDEPFNEIEVVGSPMGLNLGNNYWYSYAGGTPERLVRSPKTIFAAAYASGYVFMADEDGGFYIADVDNIDVMTYIADLGVTVTDMAYDTATETLYGVFSNYLLEIDKMSGQWTPVGPIGIPNGTNTLALDDAGNFYSIEYGTGDLYTYTLETVVVPTLVGATGYPNNYVQSIEWNPLDRTLYWAQHYYDPDLSCDQNGDELTNEQDVQLILDYVSGALGGELPDMEAADINGDGEVTSFDAHILTARSRGMAGLIKVDVEDATTTYVTMLPEETSGLIIPTESSAPAWAEPTDTVSGIRLSNSSLTVLRGSSSTLSAELMPWTLTDHSVTWSSSDETVATVDANGTVTGISAGACVITATSVVDPTASADCAVTVEVPTITITGTLQDETGNPLLYSWNLETEASWSKVIDIDPSMISAAPGGNADTAYIVDGTSANNVWRTDLTTGDGTLLSAAPVPVNDMDYSTVFSTEENDLLHMIYYYFYLPAKDPDSISTSAFNWANFMATYSGGSELLGVATGGLTSYTDNQGNSYETAEEVFLLDNAGYVWYLKVYQVGANYGAGIWFFDSNLLDIGYELNYDSNDNPLCSMILGEDGNLYLSAFNGSTNELFRLSQNEETGSFEAVKLGNVGKDVWPATLLSATTNDAASKDAVLPTTGAIEVMAETVDLSALKAAAAPAAEPVSQAASVAPSSGPTEAGTLSVSTEQGDTSMVTVKVEAANVTNGLVELTYDAELLTLEGASGAGIVQSSVYSGVYTDINETGTTGEVRFAFAAGTPVSGDVLELVFSYSKSSAPNSTALTVRTLQENAEKPNTTERVNITLREVIVINPPSGGGTITPEPVPQDPEPTDPPSSKYEDVIPGRWYVPGIDFVTERGLMDGTSETTFSPDMAASRAMVVTVLYRLAGEPEPTAECPFEDVKADSWYGKAVIWGYETGIVEGMSETEFAPLASVQREQLAAFLHRYAVWAGEDVTATDDLSGFADGGDVSGWAAEAMRWAVGAGLIEGTESGLAPKHTATRAQFALILMRYCEAFEA